MMKFRLTCFAASLALLAGCGGSDNDQASAPTATTTAPAEATATATETPTPIIEKVRGKPKPLPEVTPSGKEEPKIAVPKGDPPTELKIRDIEVGKGPEAKRGQTLVLDYLGWRFDDGVPFDSTWSTGDPFSLVLGAGQAVKGFEQGLYGMRVGGRRELIIPPDLAYGDHGQGQIRGGDTIIFVVDLLAAS